MNPPLLELTGADIRRADDARPLIENVHWRVETGDFWVIAGAYGTGKSALLGTLAGLIPPAAGQLLLFGEPPAPAGRRDAPWQRRVGLVFEAGGRLLRDLTVAENIALTVGYHDGCPAALALERVRPLIQALELEGLADIPAGRIGRAWAQRAALARALAHGPELLLLDNPAAGMDQHHLRWWRQFLPRLIAGHPALGGRPLTVVLTTAGLQPWLAVGRQFALVQDGRWRVLGDRAQLELEPAAQLAEWLPAD